MDLGTGELREHRKRDHLTKLCPCPYDPTARAAATALTKQLAFKDRSKLADAVPKQGFAARAGDHTIGELAKELIAIARDGLRRVEPGSLSLLDPVEAIATSGRTQADRIIEIWQRHAGDRAALVKALAHPGLIGSGVG